MILTAVFILVAPVIVGAAACIISGRRKKSSTPVGLLLHSITETPALHCSYFSPFKFESLVSRLTGEGFAFTTVSRAAVDVPAQGCAVPCAQRRIVMTFDDGFANFFTHGLPVCERHGIQVTVFCVAGFLGKSSSWDALPKQSHLTKSQIREISRLGHEIGSHTLSHANLTFLSEKELRTELSESKKILEDCTGKPVTSLSFPFGRINRRVWEAAKRIGFTAATSYVCNGKPADGIIPLWGAYSYDSVQDVVDRAVRQPALSHAVARGRLMPHFAKGTPLWKFRDSYSMVH
jgi:peptidoglycan/xylan/chitin deacetylase (PgdA/CDA1 family)